MSDRRDSPRSNTRVGSTFAEELPTSRATRRRTYSAKRDAEIAGSLAGATLYLGLKGDLRSCHHAITIITLAVDTANRKSRGEMGGHSDRNVTQRRHFQAIRQLQSWISWCHYGSGSDHRRAFFPFLFC